MVSYIRASKAYCYTHVLINKQMPLEKSFQIPVHQNPNFAKDSPSTEQKNHDSFMLTLKRLANDHALKLRKITL